MLETQASTLEDARRRVISQLRPGWEVVREEVLPGEELRAVEADGDTVDQAYLAAEQQLPLGVQVMERKTLAVAEIMIVELSGFTEDEARERAELKFGMNAVSATVSRPGFRGVVGFLRRPNSYNVRLLAQAKVRLTYRVPIRLCAYAKPAARFNGVPA